MTIFRHELRSGRTALLIWSGAVALMLGLCVAIYPDMSAQMEQINLLFRSMGLFSEAFGLDKLNFGEFDGYFSVECGNVLGIGGAFFAALLGISALAKEEGGHTAEFLLTHPVSRTRVVSEKLLAVAVSIAVFNLAAIAVTLLGIALIGETVDAGALALLFLAYFLMQLETAAVTFGISAFLKRNSAGIGLGLAAVFYFLNIVSNLTDKAEFLRYVTPFGYTEGSEILANHALNVPQLAAGLVFSLTGIGLAFRKYRSKDIA